MDNNNQLAAIDGDEENLQPMLDYLAPPQPVLNNEQLPSSNNIQFNLPQLDQFDNDERSIISQSASLASNLAVRRASAKLL